MHKPLYTLPSILCFIFSCALVFPAFAADDMDALEAQERAIAQRMEAATVFILTDTGMGSGFVVGNGLIMTAAHVVFDNPENILVMNSVMEPTPATVMDYTDIAEDMGNDFAILQFTPPKNTQLPVLEFNTSISRMDRVSAWGYPGLIKEFDIRHTALMEGEFIGAPDVVYTEGVVNVIQQGVAAYTTIVHSAAIAKGNSGGPLVNGKGEVVGINTWGFSQADEASSLNGALTAADMIAYMKSLGLAPHIAATGTYVAGGAPSVSSQPSNPAAFPATPGVVASVAPGVVAGASPNATGRFPAGRPEQNNTSSTQITDTAAQFDYTSYTPESLSAYADKGDPIAEYLLGFNYLFGDEGFPKDPARAKTYLEDSAAQGNTQGDYLLGILHLYYPEWHDPDKALRYFIKAAEDPDPYPQDQAFLAQLYYSAEFDGIERDLTKAVYWAKKAAAAGDADGKALLGFMYYYGEGVKGNTKKALRLAREAVNDNSDLGKALLAWMYYHGEVVEEDNAKALTLAHDAAEANIPTAQGLLAVMYHLGQGIPKDENAAEGWATRAALYTDEFGLYVLGDLHYQGLVVPKDNIRAWAMLQLSAEKGVLDSIELLPTVEADMTKEEIRKARKLQESWRQNGIS